MPDRPHSAMFGRAVLGLVIASLGACLSNPEPSLDEVRFFVRNAEAELLELWSKAERAAWIQSTYISDDTNLLAAETKAAVMASTLRFATEASRFNEVDLPSELARKLVLLRTSLAAVAPRDYVLQVELSRIMAEMEVIFGQAEYCPGGGGDCLDLPTMERIFVEKRETDELLDAWLGWRTISPEIRSRYTRFVELSNQGARQLGFADTGEMWRSAYDMPAAKFELELERLWGQVSPLYTSLHCHVRAELGEEYGSFLIPEGEPMPAHLLGNMWGQAWGSIYDSVGPRRVGIGYDLTDRLRRNRVDVVEMVRYGERFFSSLGFDRLPDTFWSRSMFVKPIDHGAVCHASAWNIDFDSDLRIKMCVGVNEQDFFVIHHELGHNYYQRAYSKQDPLFRTSANDGFHEAVGDTIALSITPDYLVRVGLLNRLPSAGRDVGLLLRQALDKIALLPFSLVVDKWRWKVFSGEIVPEEYNGSWWELRERYQGIRSPVRRTEEDFDPGAKYHVPANVPYARYFLAHILQFQFHKALCEAAGFDGLLHRCSIFGSEEAGSRLERMLELGASKPWPEALEVLTGSREIDASAVLEYFEPLKVWLDQQNADRLCGW